MTSHRKIVSLLMSICFIAATATTAFAQDAATTEAAATAGKCGFQTLSFPPPATKGQAVALNDSGAIVGSYGDAQNVSHGFLLYQGRLTSFMFPGSSGTNATDISRNGIIVGGYSIANDPKQHAFMVHSGGFHEITLPGHPNADVTVTGVNANGDVVGNFFDPNANNSNGFLLQNGRLTILSFPGGDITLPTSINDEGVIVGGYLILFVNENPSFMLKDGVFSNIEPPGNDGFVTATKVSNSGAVVGFYEAFDGTHGFALKNGTYTKIDAPGFPQATLIQAVNKFDNVLIQAEHSTQQGVNLVEFKGFCGAVF